MVMEKLVSNTEFGFYLRNLNKGSYISLRMNYDEFLSQKLELSMFVPCDSDGNVLEDTYSTKTDRNDYFDNDGGNPELYSYNLNKWKEYQEAKDRVLFDGFEFKYEDKYVQTISNGKLFFNYRKMTKVFFLNDRSRNNVEDLVNCSLVLTETAKKQIGL